jgi:PhnB protein
MKTANKNTKSKRVQPVPKGYHTVTPLLMVSDAQGLLDFIEQGLNGKTEFKMKDNDGKIVHASAKIGDSQIMLGDVMGGYEPITAMLYLYVEDADELYKQALTFKGTKAKRELRDEFYGDRSGSVEDPWGNTWWIATHIEDVSDEELRERKSQMMSEEHHA